MRLTIFIIIEVSKDKYYKQDSVYNPSGTYSSIIIISYYFIYTKYLNTYK